MYFSKKVYAVYNGVWGKAPEAGEFSRIFVLKVTLQSVTLILTVSYRKMGSRMLRCSLNCSPCSPRSRGYGFQFSLSVSKAAADWRSRLYCRCCFPDVSLLVSRLPTSTSSLDLYPVYHSHYIALNQSINSFNQVYIFCYYYIHLDSPHR